MKIRVSPPQSDFVRPAGRAGDGLNLTLFVGLCALLAFGPLAFGAVQPWAICVIEVGAAFLFLLWALRELVSPPSSISFEPMLLPLALTALLVAAQLAFHRTAYWYLSKEQFLLWLAYGAIFFLVGQSLAKPPLRRWFAVFFSLYGAAVALFAIAQQFTGNGKLYWVFPNRNLGWIYGPYVYHAHYAGLMELLTPLALILALSNFYARPFRILFGLAALLMGSSIFLSQSLGGILSFIAQLAFISVVLARGGRSRNSLAAIGALCLLLVVSLVALRPEGLAQRLSRLQDPIKRADGGSRVAIVQDSWRMGQQHPVLGWGLGTFPAVYPAYRTFYSDLWVNEAHNDYLQLWIETGAAGVILIAVFLFLLYRTGLRNVEHWRRHSGAAVGLAALAGCTGMLVHALFDFNLQVPANAALFFALAAIAGVQEPLPARRGSRTQTVKLNYVYGR